MLQDYDETQWNHELVSTGNKYEETVTLWSLARERVMFFRKTESNIFGEISIVVERAVMIDFKSNLGREKERSHRIPFQQPQNCRS